MDVLTTLHADHERVAQLFQQLLDTTERARQGREELFATLRRELMLHAEAEQEVFYPALKEEAEAADLVEEGIDEHEQAMELLDRLSETRKDDPAFVNTLRELQQAVEHHVEEEERRMFARARETLGADELTELGAELEDAKTELGER